jgi:peroxiredoxin
MKTAILGLVMLTQVSALAAIAPSFRGETADGDRVSLSGLLKPNRALLLCFWATWCVPCIEEMRQVSERIKNDPTVPLDVVAVNVDTSETSSDVKPTIRQYGFSFPIILDPKHEIFTRYQQENSLPFSALIDGKGNIRHTFSGYHEEMFAEVKKLAEEKN